MSAVITLVNAAIAKVETVDTRFFDNVKSARAFHADLTALVNSEWTARPKDELTRSAPHVLVRSKARLRPKHAYPLGRPAQRGLEPVSLLHCATVPEPKASR